MGNTSPPPQPIVELRSPAAPQKSDRWLPLIYAAALGLAVAGAYLADHFRFPTPLCWFRTVTGLPCPGCGGTRCLLALAHLDLARAARMNPLAFLGAAAIVGWLPVWVAETVAGQQWTLTLLNKIKGHRWLIFAFIAALLANWVYLLLYLPR